MSNNLKNILANVNINASYDVGSNGFYEEEALELDPDSDPFLCIMLSGMSPKSVFQNLDYDDEDLMLYIMGPEEIANRLASGAKLRDKGEHTRVMVNNIRDYYTNRLIEEKLTGKTRSNIDFGTDLMAALNIRGCIRPKFVGLYNKLWDMYDSDIAWDMFITNCKSATQDYDTFRSRSTELKFFTSIYGVSNKSLSSKSRKLNFVRYFFVDKEKNLYEHSVTSNSPIKIFLESYFQTYSEADRPWKTVSISTRRKSSPVPVYRDDFMYYKIYDWARLN
jgi:hypothetical protein